VANSNTPVIYHRILILGNAATAVNYRGIFITFVPMLQKTNTLTYYSVVTITLIKYFIAQVLGEQQDNEIPRFDWQGIKT